MAKIPRGQSEFEKKLRRKGYSLVKKYRFIVDKEQREQRKLRVIASRIK